MKKLLYILIIHLLLIDITSYTQTIDDREITVEELKEHLFILASDSLKGRKTGTAEGKIAANYIKEQFKNAGLRMMADDGFQYFELVTDIEPGSENSLNIDGLEYDYQTDYSVYAFSESNKVIAEIAFVGYGLDINENSLKWDDYEGVAVNNKWVIILKGDPGPDNNSNKFIDYSSDREKVLTARDKGAAGVIFVSGPKFDKFDQLVSLYFDRTKSDAGLPVINIKRYVADSLLISSGYPNIENIEKKISETKKTYSFNIDAKVIAKTDLVKKTVTDQNVIGAIDGSNPELQNKYIVVGAHYDHLGMGGAGSNSRMPDTIAVHNGADDNASGVTCLIEIAEKIAAGPDLPRRSIVFIAFGAEEMGLIGSSYFVKNPTVDIDKIFAMINLDMVGRLDNDKRSVLISGTGTALESEQILKSLSANYDLTFNYSPEGYGPSDHAVFYASDIPVFFITTGAHQDYHTPFDDVEFINFNGQRTIAEFTCDLIMDLAERQEHMTFQKAGRKKGTRYRSKLKVTLGIMPDFTSASDEGLGVGGVTEGKPADKAGMKKGDLIIALNGKPVKNIYDYMNRMKKFEPGQIITVDVIRDGEKKVLLVNL